MMALREITAGIFILIFGFSFVLGVLSHLAEKKFLKWLYINNLQLWEELGRPRAFFFDTSPENSPVTGTSAWEFLKRTGGLDEFARKHSKEEGISYLLRSRRYSRLSIFLMVVALILLIVMVGM